MKKLSDIASRLVPPFEPCANCSNGWLTHQQWVTTTERVLASTRCSCWKAHQSRIQQAVAQAAKEKA